MHAHASDTPVEAAAASLTASLKQYQTTPLLLMLSGGSALQLLEYVDPTVLGSHITITTLDERYTPNQLGNNYELLAQTGFFADALSRGAVVLETKVLPLESFHDFALRIDAGIRAWQAEYPNGVVIATMGIGIDGHTAGLFEKVEETVFSSDRILGHTLPSGSNDFLERVTVTPEFLRDVVTTAVVLATGEDKRLLIERLRHAPDSEHMPAKIIFEMNEVHLFHNNKIIIM